MLKSAMGCHGNHAFSHNSYQMFLGHLCFAFSGPNEQFLAPMKIVMGCKVTKIGSQGNIV